MIAYFNITISFGADALSVWVMKRLYGGDRERSIGTRRGAA
jgi:hypothetical protein